MAFNTLRGTVNFSNYTTGTIESMVDDYSDQTIGGVKTFTSIVSASAISLAGSVLEHPALTSISGDAATRIVVSDGDGTATCDAGLVFSKSSLTASYYSGSAIGLTNVNLAPHKVSGQLSASSLFYGVGLSASQGNAIAVSGGVGIASTAQGVYVDLPSNSGLNFSSDKLIVDPNNATTKGSWSASDEVLIADSDASSALKKATVTTLATYMQNTLTFTTPGGSDTAVQFNSGSTLSGSAKLLFQYAESTPVLKLTGEFSASSEATVRGLDVFHEGIKRAYLSSSGEVSASAALSASAVHTLNTVINAAHLSSSLNISGSAFYGDGNKLNNVPISGYTNTRLVFCGATTDTLTTYDGLTWNNPIMSVPGTVSATNLSASTLVSASAFYGDGSGLTNVGSDPGGGNTAVQFNSGSTLSGSAKLLFDYAESTAVLKLVGEFSASGDATTAGIDVFNAGIKRAYLSSSGEISSSAAVSASSMHTLNSVINTTHISSSLNISGSAFYGDGSNLTGLSAGAVDTYTNSGDNRIITSVNSSTINGEANLTFDGAVLDLTGQISASLGISGSSFYVEDQIVHTGDSDTYIEFTEDNIEFKVGSVKMLELQEAATDKVTVGNGGDVDFQVKTVANNFTIYAEGSTDKVGIRTATPAAVLHITGSGMLTGTEEELFRVDGDAGSGSLFVSGSGRVGIGTTDPQTTLHVKSDVAQFRIEDTTVDYAYTIDCDGAQVVTHFGDLTDGESGKDAFMSFGAYGGINRLDTASRDFHLYGTTTPTGFYFDESSGSFGFGTTTPEKTVTVVGQISASLGVSGSTLETGATVINATHVSSSLNISGSSFYGDGSNLTGIAGGGVVETYTNAANNRVITSVNATSINGEAGLLFDGSMLEVAGEISASSNISGAIFYGEGRRLTYPGGVTTAEIPFFNSGTLEQDASLLYLELGDAGPNTSTLVVGAQLSASQTISASFFYGNGGNLTGLPGGAPATASGGTGEIQFARTTDGEFSSDAALVFNTGSAGASGTYLTSSNLVVSYNTHLTGALYGGYKIKNSNYTLTSDDHYVYFNTTPASNLTASLPAASNVDGIIYVIKNVGSGELRVAADGSDVIDGAAYDESGAGPVGWGLSVQSINGTGWAIIHRV